MKRAIFLLVILMTGVVLAQRDTLLQGQTFDTAWSTTNPPDGWRITYSGDPNGNDAWHRQTTFPWTGNTTPYAAIWYASTGDHTDSLISPRIDCSRHRNIHVRCSTYFLPRAELPYVARVLASDDDGATWRVIRDYYAENDTVGPGLEDIHIDSTGMTPNLRLCWVWSGNLTNIDWWCVDNISVLGTPIFDVDAAAWKIVRPQRHELPRSFSPTGVYLNRGFNTLYSVPVGYAIYRGSQLVHSGSTLIPEMARSERDTIVYSSITLSETTYTAIFYSAVLGDEYTGNDTLERTFDVADTDYIHYDDDIVAGEENWLIGGNSGWGLKVTPVAYPALIRFSQFKLHVPDSISSFYKVRIVDDDGASCVPGHTEGSPGTTIYESSPISGSEGWNADQLEDLQLILLNGSCYIFYVQIGDWPFCPSLYHDSTRSGNAEYWVLNGGSYYPDADTTNGDWMIRCMLYYNVSGADSIDARTMYVSQPDDELTLRPAGVSFVPAARIENHGLLPLTGFPVVCTIYAAGPPPTPVYSSTYTVSDWLNPDQGMYVSFDTWTPGISGAALVTVRTDCPDDTTTSNDAKSKAIMIYRPRYTSVPEIQDRYAWIDSDTTGGPTYNWIDTAGFYTAISDSAEGTVLVPLYFDFVYRGNTYGAVRLSSNGWMSFDSTTGARPGNESIPTAGLPNNAIYPFWDHLVADPAPESRVCFNTIGTEPNRKFVTVWNGMRFSGVPSDSQRVTFEVILEQGTGIITCQYKDVVGGLATHNYGKSATVGIENGAGMIGSQYLFGDSGVRGLWPANKLTDGRAIMFYQVRRDAGVTSIVAPASPWHPGLVTPRAWVKNYGSFVEPFYTYFRVYTMSGTNIYNDSVLVDTLWIQRSRLLSFGDWNAAFGSYIIKCSTALGADVDPSNNAITATISIQPWLAKADIPRGVTNRRVKAGGLAFDGQYIYGLKGANTNEFWRYDIPSDTWTQLPDVPMGNRNKRTKDGCCIAATGDSLIYVLKGGNTREFYAFNTTSQAWGPQDSFPAYPTGKGARNGTTMTFAQSKLYMLRGNNTNDFLRFDVAQHRWDTLHGVDTIATSIPVRFKRGATLCHGKDSFLFAVVGSNGRAFLRYNLNRLTDTWHRMPLVPFGPTNRKVKAGACAATVSDTLYLLKGGNTTEFWACKLNPYDTHNIWRRRSDIPMGIAGKRVKTGAAMTASQDMIYVFKGGNRQEFWLYGPGYDTGSVATALLALGAQSNPSPPGLLEFTCRAQPNPSVGPPAIGLSLPAATNARIKVYDITGELVNTIWNGPLAAGRHRITWDGRDRLGRRVAGGVYVLRFESAKYRSTQKLILEW